MNNKIKNFFGFKKLPFSKPIASNELFQSGNLKDVYSHMELAVENEDFALITGSAGSGKSSSLRYFISQLDPLVYPHIYITCENYKIGDISKLILAGLNLSIPYQGYAALQSVKNEISKMYSQKNCKPVVIIDEAQQLSIQTLLSIKNLASFNMDSTSMLLIILCGQFELIGKIKNAQLESLRRRIRIQYRIQTMSLEECSKFIKYHMKRSGVERPIFSDEVVAEIFQISQGVISNINNICFDLIFHAVRESKEIIDLSLLDKIILPE